MDLIDRLREIAAKIPKLKTEGLIKTEEGTKNALVMPFINALGYNVFDPLEVTPELIADVGVKKGEKVDYAILKDGKPIIIFECKIVGTDLSQVHASQLYRYFSVTAARFGILTDGVIYRFYTDLEAPNKMDITPFFVFDLTDIKEPMVEELKRFTKPMFDQDSILTTASELKYKSAIKTYFEAQFDKPSEAFVRLFLQESHAYTGRLTQTVIEQFAPIIRESLRLFVGDQVEKRLKSALEADTRAKEETAETAAVVVDPAPDKVVTTQDELDAYLVVKAIVRGVIDVKRVVLKDVQSYCSILIDNNNRRPLCRLYFNSAQKYVGFIHKDKSEEKLPVSTIDDIYQYAERLVATAKQYTESSPEAG